MALGAVGVAGWHDAGARHGDPVADLWAVRLPGALASGFAVGLVAGCVGAVLADPSPARRRRGRWVAVALAPPSAGLVFAAGWAGHALDRPGRLLASDVVVTGVTVAVLAAVPALLGAGLAWSVAFLAQPPAGAPRR